MHNYDMYIKTTLEENYENNGAKTIEKKKKVKTHKDMNIFGVRQLVHLQKLQRHAS